MNPIQRKVIISKLYMYKKKKTRNDASRATILDILPVLHPVRRLSPDIVLMAAVGHHCIC